MEKNDQIIVNLQNANQELQLLNSTVNLVLVGGAALVLLNVIHRATHDIDYINHLDKRVAIILEKHNINCRALTFESTFGKWQADIHDLKGFTFSNIKIQTISVERMLVSRLFSNKRADDFINGFENAKFERQKFEQILIEIYDYCNPVFKREFENNQKMLQNCYKSRKWDWNENTQLQKLFKK